MQKQFCLLLALSVLSWSPAWADDDAPESYPRITALEKTILGQAYSNQSLDDRLGRMEIKAFGSKSKDDFSDRADALEQYAKDKLHKTPIAENDDDQEVDPVSSSDAGQSTNDDGQSTSDYPHISALEQAILGQTYSGQPLPDRLDRMEVKAFGSASSNSDMSVRTDALENYADKKLHKRTIQKQETASAPAGPGVSRSAQILSMVGTSLLGMTGLGMLPMMAAPMLASRMAQGANNSGGPTPDTQPEVVHADDPVTHAAEPPPATAKLITKAGWCEVQLYGQTFANMHLMGRLNQINRTLNYKPGKSGADLMDDIDGMMKATQEQRKSDQALSSTTSAPAN